jgi:hypothetical protein
MAKGPRRGQPLPPTKQPDAKGRISVVRYGPKPAKAICERLARGDVWFKICNSEGMPSYTTLYAWIKKHPEFAEQVAQAREMFADACADKALITAEESAPSTVQCDRLRVGVLQWRAAKAAPRKYGSRAEEDGTGEQRLIVEIRRFERAERPDGTSYVREMLPDFGRRR